MPDMLTMVRGEYQSGMFVHQSSPPMLVELAVDFPGYAWVTFQKLPFFITPCWLPHHAAHTVINPAVLRARIRPADRRYLQPAGGRRRNSARWSCWRTPGADGGVPRDDAGRFRSPLSPAGAAGDPHAGVIVTSRCGDRERLHPLPEGNTATVRDRTAACPPPSHRGELATTPAPAAR